MSIFTLIIPISNTPVDRIQIQACAGKDKLSELIVQSKFSQRTVIISDNLGHTRVDRTVGEY